ncbi:hypothetical protein BT63DRAFT_422755 [Microthyrium microscopicum]|uniref:Uncharacterized protein n=1 Tax=Microthyrium microscopicum TaxID=703497 RepID=A0A6A6UJ53_9PEZI|nr:hypothetical protein BT63DRAFT_422755 [Microthyrium microscopicum]
MDELQFQVMRSSTLPVTGTRCIARGLFTLAVLECGADAQLILAFRSTTTRRKNPPRETEKVLL